MVLRLLQKNDSVSNDEYNIEKYVSENFFDQPKIGENNDKVCILIRKDQIKEFIVFISTNNYGIKITISPSIYETNNFLFKPKFKSITLIVIYGIIILLNTEDFRTKRQRKKNIMDY